MRLDEIYQMNGKTQQGRIVKQGVSFRASVSFPRELYLTLERIARQKKSRWRGLFEKRRRGTWRNKRLFSEGSGEREPRSFARRRGRWKEPMETREAGGKPTKRGLEAAMPLNEVNSLRQLNKAASSRQPRRVRVVSYFSGCGGMDLGFRGGFAYGGDRFGRQPFEIVRAYDFDLRCVETYRLNISERVEEAALHEVKPAEVPGADVLIGGFPCQDFSSCGPQKGLASPRGRLYRAMVDYMEHHHPIVAVGENVPHLARIDSGNVMERIIRDLKEAGYRVYVWDLYAPDFGIPQRRSRLFFVCVRDDAPGEPPPPEPEYPADEHRSIDWAIDDLAHISDETVPNQSQYFLASRAKKGNGQGDEKSKKGRPAYTVRANAKSRVQFHYALNRRLTVRECARLQSFPDNFVFPHSATTTILPDPPSGATGWSTRNRSPGRSSRSTAAMRNRRHRTPRPVPPCADRSRDLGPLRRPAPTAEPAARPAAGVAARLRQAESGPPKPGPSLARSCGPLRGTLHSGAMNVQGDRVRLGVIGYGMVCDSYLQTLRRFDHVAFAACADMEPERARRVAAEYGFGRACGVDELVRGDDTDLVHNLTVPAAHAEINLAVLDGGKHVSSEKPLGITLQEAQAVLRRAEDQGLRVGCAPDTFLAVGPPALPAPGRAGRRRAGWSPPSARWPGTAPTPTTPTRTSSTRKGRDRCSTRACT